MRYFVPSFELFGESDENRFSPEFYMHTLAKVSHIKEFLALDGNTVFSEKVYNKICKSYRGCYGTDSGMSVKGDGTLEIEYDIFKTKNYNGDDRVWTGSCKLKIWLTKKEVLKLYGL